jgi:hypothetical protein
MKRTTIKRKIPLRRSRRPKPMSRLARKRRDQFGMLWRRKADALWGQLIHLLGKETCLIGGGHCSGPVQAHHLISRARLATRHDPENGVLLCSFHHEYSTQCSPHGGPAGFFAWLEKYRPDLWAYCKRHRWADGSSLKINYAAICADLQAKLDSAGAARRGASYE